MTTIDAADESTALLATNRPSSTSGSRTPPSSSAPRSSSCPSPSPLQHHASDPWPWIYFVGVVLAIAVVSDVGETLWMAPRIRLFESTLCKDHYLRVDPSLIGEDGSVPEKLCKVDPIQHELAFILGVQALFDSVPAIILPIPYGYLADKRGRKWILILSLWGYAASYAWTLLATVGLHLPLPFVWLSSLFYLVGGGPTTATTLLTTVVADVVPTEVRGVVFFYRFCTDLVADLVAAPITSYLMSRTLLTPLMVAVCCQAITGIMYVFVPETLRVSRDVEGASLGDEADSRLLSDVIPSEPTHVGKKLRAWLHSTKASFAFITQSTTVCALVFTFLISKVGRQSTNMLFQYVSKRYNWTLAQASLLVSLRAAVNIALFTVVLPVIATWGLRGWSAASKDWLFARGSIVLLALGTSIIFVSTTPLTMITGVVLFTLGSGFPPAVRSLVTSFVEGFDDGTASDIGRLYAVISTMEGIGTLLAAPGMAWALNIGISWGHDWLGLPFGLAAALFVCVAIIVFSIKRETL